MLVYLIVKSIFFANLRKRLLRIVSLQNIPNIIQFLFLHRAADAIHLSPHNRKDPAQSVQDTVGHITFAQCESAHHKPLEKFLDLRETANVAWMHIPIFSFTPSSKQDSFARNRNPHQIYTFFRNISQASCLATILLVCSNVEPKTLPRPIHENHKLRF